MGAVNFDVSAWLSAADAKPAIPAIVAIPEAENSRISRNSSPAEANGQFSAGDRKGLVGFKDKLATLDPTSPPPQLSTERWRQMIDDADRFLSRWGDQAAALGWSELDLFGVSPGFARRLDRDGLVYALEGRSVIAMTAEAATIDAGGGKATRHYRMVPPGAMTWWSAAYGELL